MREKLFEKDYSWCKDEIGQKILEENFRQFNLKTPEERERILQRNFGINVKVGE